MLVDFWNHINSPQFTREATWLTIYCLVPFAFITAIFMLKLGPRLLIDWGYAWVMAAFGLWVLRIIWIVKIHPQPIGSTIWSLAAALQLLVAMLFTMAVLLRTGYQIFRDREHHV